LDFEEEILPYEANLLKVSSLLTSQLMDLEQSQQESVFHTRCNVFENICSVIVDSGSCCSSRLVDRLALTIVQHPKPYKL